MINLNQMIQIPNHKKNSQYKILGQQHPNNIFLVKHFPNKKPICLLAGNAFRKDWFDRKHIPEVTKDPCCSAKENVLLYGPMNESTK